MRTAHEYTRHITKVHTFYELANLNYIFVPRETFTLLREFDLVTTDEVEYVGHDEVSVTVNCLTGRDKGHVIKVYDRSILSKTVSYKIKFHLEFPKTKSQFINNENL